MSGIVGLNPNTAIVPEVEGAIQQEIQKNQFEWNIPRLYSYDPNLSETRNVWVSILSAVFVFPVILTLIVDLGRRLAFSVGLVNGKSWSLIEEASTTIGRIGELFQSKVLTLEEENLRSEKRIQAQAQRLINGYLGLNGGYFHTNGSFSSPAALSAERDIARAQERLIDEMVSYAARNATNIEDFAEQVSIVEAIVADAIATAARDEYYIANKIERLGPPQFLKDVANDEFFAVLKLSRPVFARKFVELAGQTADFTKSLKNGVASKVLTEEQAKVALRDQARAVYNQGLEKGLVQADSATEDLLESAKTENLVTEQEANAVLQNIGQLDARALAEAVAKDLAQGQTATVSDMEIDHILIKTAEKLRAQGNLQPDQMSLFVTEAKAQFAKAKEAAFAEELQRQQEAEELEAKRVVAEQLATNQQALFKKFADMLGLIRRRQEEIASQFSKYDGLEQNFQNIANQLEESRNAVVTINSKPMTVLQAAPQYYAAVSSISKNKKLSPTQRQERIKDLVSQGFTEQTINKINELRSLEPQLTNVIDEEADLFREMGRQYEEINRLISVYKVFRHNNLEWLVPHNHKVISEVEKEILAAQKKIGAQYVQLSHQKKQKESLSVNVDPEGNRAEVEELVRTA